MRYSKGGVRRMEEKFFPEQDFQKGKKGSYDVGDQNACRVYVNGYRVRTDYYFEITERGFKKTICSKKKSEFREAEVIIVLRKGCLEKEIRIKGFIRKLIIGEWE